MRLDPRPLLPRSIVGEEEVVHTWLGVVGPRPTVISALSLVLVGAMFAHLVLPLPAWWPFAIGAVAIVINAGLAYWQAGSFRVVAVTSTGIQVFRKGRWTTECMDLVGTMPRMPLGPLDGRWCQASVANTMIWVNRKYHPIVADFDADYRSRYGEAYRAITRPSTAPLLSD